MEISICPALPEHAYEYTICHVACWRSAYKGIISNEYLDTMFSEQRVEDCKQALSEPDIYEFYYVEFKGNMIGRLIISKSRDDDKPNAGEIDAIYLLKEFWDKGYGWKMMKYATHRLKNIGYNEVIVWVLEENDRVRRFYEKFGFVFDGTKKEIALGTSLVEIRCVLNLQ